MSVTVYFYSNLDEYGCFSNFSRHGFELDGRYWPTSEHYFQAQKFAGTEHEERVRRARSPKDAANLGRDRSLPLRADWEQVKEDVMRRAVFRKFTVHADLRDTLLQTGDEELVENAPGDFYWGCGADGTGQNRLGHILMEIRTELRKLIDVEKGSRGLWPRLGNRGLWPRSHGDAKRDPYLSA